ncbi:MAG: hypothetical protein RXQ96_02100 [Thermocladium sp.]
MRHPLTLLYYIDSIIIIAISLLIPPHYWWVYGISDLAVIKDSPFYLYITLLGKPLIISSLITIILIGFGLYVITVLLIYSYMLVKRGEARNYSTMFWLPILYVLDPVIVYLVLAIVMPHLVPLLGNSSLGTRLSSLSSYPLVIIGQEQYSISIGGGEEMTLIIYSEPSMLYWLSLTAPLLYLASLIERRRASHQ